MAEATQAVAEQAGAPKREYAGWLIMKGGYYYRPNWSGYTSDQAQAGRYTRSQADREAAVEPENFKVVRAPEVYSSVADIVAECRDRLQPYGFAVVPRELTAENGMKAALIGDLRTSYIGRDEFGDEQRVDYCLSWDDTKRLWREMLAQAETVTP